MTGHTSPEGFVASGWEPVRDAFAQNFAEGRDVGAGVAIYHRGELKVDLRGGWFDSAQSRPYDHNTLQLVFSTTKGVTAIAVGMCVDRGLLSYDEKVSTYWPEFAAGGKGDITVAQLLSHQAGLYSVDGPITVDDALDWGTITARLAAQAPLFTPGSTHGYHALTYGWLAGELVRRVDPQHRSLGTFVTQEITGPLGAEFWVGLPEQHESRVSPMIAAAPPEDPAILKMMMDMMGPGTNAFRALYLEGAFFPQPHQQSPFNTRAVHAAEIPAANGIGTAAALAKIYAATLQPIDGVQLLSAATRERARKTVTPAGEADACLVLPSTFGMGFMTTGFMSPYLGEGCYGHPGAGGSVAFAAPEDEIAFAYVMNQMDNNLANDPRTVNLCAAVRGIIG